MSESALEGFAGITEQVAGLFEELGVTEPEGLVGHWAVATPAGRAWIVGQTWDKAGSTIRESDVLKWGFSSELLQIGIPPPVAPRLVEQAITLREIRVHPVPDLMQRAASALQGFPVEVARAWLEGGKHEIEALGDDLKTIAFYDLLAVSDFHLAAGNRPSPEGLARLSPTEDFFFDNAFFRFLVHSEEERRSRQGYPYELVFNGDMVDFVQVVVRATAEPDAWDLDLALPEELQLGAWDADARAYAQAEPQRERLWDTLDTVYGEVADQGTRRQIVEERASRDAMAWAQYAQEKRQAARGRQAASPRQVLAMGRSAALVQLKEVCRGHPRFFQGVAWFLACGNRLVLMRGNHDIQWYWPELQDTLVGWLKEVYDDLDRECRQEAAGHSLPVAPERLQACLLPATGADRFLPPLPAEEFTRRVDFDHPWFYYRDRLAYFEHGGQHEAVDAHRHFLIPVYDNDRTWPAPRPRPELQALVDQPPERATGWLPELEVVPEEDEIDPALGSLGNVFLVNNLEIEMPNFERPGYDKVYLPWLLYRRPRVLFGALGPAIGRLVDAWRRWAGRQPDLLDRQVTRREAYARLTGLSEDCVRELDDTRWVKQWRGKASGWVYALINVLSVVVPVVAVLVVVLGLSEAFRWLSVGDWLQSWLPLGVQKLLGLAPSDPAPSGNLLVWDFLSGALKTVVVGLLSYWAVTAVRDWIGLGEDYLYRPSLRVARILKRYGWDVPYILFGHDHARNAQPLDLGKQCDHPDCPASLKKRDVQLIEGRLEVRRVACPHCGDALDKAGLQYQFGESLRKASRQEPTRYTVTCPHCEQETAVGADTDWSGDGATCERCGHALTQEEVIGNSTLWATPADFHIEPLACPSCQAELPSEILERVRVFPYALVYACPGCSRVERQLLGTWFLACPNPECGKKPKKSDLQLAEERPYIHCTCGTTYPQPAPAHRWYLNTGTWMHFYATERKRLVRDVLEYPFVRMVDTHMVLAARPNNYMDPWDRPVPRVELLRWNDGAQRVEACETYQGTAEGTGHGR